MTHDDTPSSKGDTKGGLDELPVLQNPVATKSLPLWTHKQCVEAATTYLSKRCNVVLPEFYSWNGELADVIGFASRHSTLIECKVSRGDFLKDRSKHFRAFPEQGMGDYRYYCCPKGMIDKKELPEGWGLLYLYPNGRVREISDSRLFEKNMKAEHHLLYYYARRANYAGVHKVVLDYRGFDK